MKKSELYIVISIVFLFAFFFILIPYWKYQHEGNKSIERSDLVEVQSKVETVRKTTTGGKHSEPIIYVTLENYPQTFRITNSSYRAVNDIDVVAQLRNGTFVSILTRQSEIDRSVSRSIIDKVLNGLLKWRRQPLIYGLSSESSELLTIEQFNQQQSDFNYENIKWGIILVLFVIGRLTWAFYEDRKKERTTTTALSQRADSTKRNDNTLNKLWARLTGK